MFRPGKLARRAALCAALLTPMTAAGQEAVVLNATVPGYTSGMVISATDRLSLPDGSTATLLFRSGQMLRLRGPFEGTLTPPQTGGVRDHFALLLDMFRSRGVDATALGATRSTRLSGPDVQLDDVLVDSQHSATYCVDASTTVWLTRPVEDAAVVALKRQGNRRTLVWPRGADRIEWPSDVPIDDAATFEVVLDGISHAAVTFHQLSDTTGLARLAQAMTFGCHAQFDSQLRKVGQAVTGPELWINSDRGRQPHYASNQPVRLSINTNSDGYLYCVATQPDGSATPIFPAGAVDGAQVRGSVPVLIPGQRQQAGLTATATVKQVRCWLADRDLTAELPHGLVAAPSGPLPDTVASDLDALFGRLRGTRIATDAITIRPLTQ